MNNIIIDNPALGPQTVGPFSPEECFEIAEKVDEIHQLSESEFPPDSNVTHVEGAGLWLRADSIAKGRVLGHFQLKDFDYDETMPTPQDEIDKWGDLYGFLLWGGTVCSFHVEDVMNDSLEEHEKTSLTKPGDPRKSKRERRKERKMNMKQEVRFLAFTDAPYRKGPADKKDTTTKIIGVITRGGTTIEAILSVEVTIDSLDATDKLIKLVNNSRFKPIIKGIFFKGLSVAGFNIIDIERISKETEIPAIIINRKRPNPAKMLATLAKLNFPEEFSEIIRRTPEANEYKNTFFQVVGCEPEEVNEMLQITQTNSDTLPEPLRLASLIASGITLGESR